MRMQRTIELAREALASREPLEGLRAIVSLRHELQDLEAAHVAAALREGRSWSTVGEALGISKQAAHKRHATRARAEAGRAAPPAPQRRLLVTGQARRMVERARAEASAAGGAEIRPEHLLLGLLGDDHGTALRALQSAGVELTAARAALPTRAAVTTGGAYARDRVRVSAEAREALEDSLREAIRLGDSHLGVEHVLLALLRDPDSPSAELLAHLGVPPERVTRRVHELVGGLG
jgi:Clp amino terminal domain, pathogenicity island component